jgi:hypothetical protein
MKKEFDSMQTHIKQRLSNFSFNPIFLLIKEKMQALQGETASREL